MATRNKQLQQQRADLTREGRALIDKARAEGRFLNQEERDRDAAIEAELTQIEGELEVEQRQLERERRSIGAPPLAAPPAEERPGAPSPAGFSGPHPFGAQLQAIAAAANPDRMGPIDARLAPYSPSASATGLGESVQSDGGFLVMKDVSSDILKRTYSIGEVASRVTRIPISAGSNGLKINAIDETSRATGSRWGGVQVYWTPEGGTVTATRPKFRQIELTLRKLMGLVYATDELIQDAAALESIVMQALPEEINFSIEDAIFTGTGSGQMLGFMNSGATIVQTKESGQLATTIVYENVLNMWSRMYARSRPNAVWFINQDCEPQLYSMNQKIGTGGVPVYMPAGGISGAPYSSLFGRPVIPVEYCSTLGTQGDIVLADLSQYLMIDKSQIQAASSMHVRFNYDEMVYRFVYRADGQPIWHLPLTPKNGTKTQSPFIVLENR